MWLAASLSILARRCASVSRHQRAATGLSRLRRHASAAATRGWLLVAGGGRLPPQCRMRRMSQAGFMPCRRGVVLPAASPTTVFHRSSRGSGVGWQGAAPGSSQRSPPLCTPPTPADFRVGGALMATQLVRMAPQSHHRRHRRRRRPLLSAHARADSAHGSRRQAFHVEPAHSQSHTVQSRCTDRTAGATLRCGVRVDGCAGSFPAVTTAAPVAPVAPTAHHALRLSAPHSPARSPTAPAHCSSSHHH